MRVCYSPGYVAEMTKNHVFPMKKFSGLHAYLREHSIVRDNEIIEPSMAEMSALMMAHSRKYTEGVWEGTLNQKEIRKIGLPWSKSLAVRSRLAVQGTINAGMMALQDGIAGNIAGGTHHAMPEMGEGFCVYNDVAVAAKVLQKSMWANKILVVDCDVHQGNGTAFIFRNDPDVFTFSIHGERNYPFQKPPSDLDVGLADGTGDRAYQKALIDALDKIMDAFNPDLVFYLGGIDPLEEDHFGRLSLSLNGLRERERIILETFTHKDIPMVLLLSGGYAPSVQKTVEAHAQMYEVAKEMGF